ncbi:MAG: cation-transporting P-type ATPase [Anaerolineae bacterium]
MTKQQLWHTLELEEVFTALEASPSGLETDEAARRLEEYGPNELESAHKVSKLAILWAQIKNPLVFVLLAAAAISLLAGKTADAIVIGVVIIVNSLIGFFQESAPKRRWSR